MKLGRNVLYNLAGLTIPVVLALACIPTLIKVLGIEVFGLLTLVWVLLGYFSLFDIGIGRALTRILADLFARGEYSRVTAWLWTASCTSFTLGIFFGGLLILFSSSLTRLLASDSPELWNDIDLAIRLIGVALPFVTVTAALRGALEARHFFGLTNTIRVGMGFFSYAGPLVLTMYTTNLSALVAFLLIGRLIFFSLHLFFVVKRYSEYLEVASTPKYLDKSLLRPLLGLGGWMAVSNFVSPLLTYLDRFLVSGIVGAAVLAYYTTPYEAVMKVTVVPDALNGVLFPALVAAIAKDPQVANRLFVSSFRLLLGVLIPLIGGLVVAAPRLLTLWISTDFALRSAAVLQVLAIGVLVNSMARLPFTAIQSAGRADITAKLHLLELPIFVVLLWLLTVKFGIVGAAIAWTIRVSLDFVLLEFIRRRFLPSGLSFGLPQYACLFAFFGLMSAALFADSSNSFIGLAAVPILLLSSLSVVGRN